jgi:FkbM family methyltransferase
MPEAIALLQQLDQAADLPSDFNYQFPNQQHSIQTLLQLHYAQIFSQSDRVDKNQSIKKDLNSKYDRETIAVMELILGADSNCIDVGCHTGEILTEILKIAPSGTHYCFEPLPSFYQALLNRFQNLKNVNFSNFALSDSERETSFIFVESNPGFSGFQKRRFFRDNLECEENTIEITVKTQLLDNLIPQSQTIDLIKIDVEGAEDKVLKSFFENSQKNRWQKHIIIEHLFPDIWEWNCLVGLEKLGYRSVWVGPMNTIYQIDSI